jgi:hypothetical protein
MNTRLALSRSAAWATASAAEHHAVHSREDDLAGTHGRVTLRERD